MVFLLNMNGTNRAVDVDGDTPFPWALRDVHGMTGTKFGCGAGARERDMTVAATHPRPEQSM
jgi:aerobic-type carbon monoxide dehydrogenase small subunit (CoxS/CutS family)